VVVEDCGEEDFLSDSFSLHIRSGANVECRTWNPPLSFSYLMGAGLDTPVDDRSNFGALAVGVKGAKRDSHDHLLAGKQGVADELAGAQSNLSVGHFSG
jgi:hypothetical protein